MKISEFYPRACRFRRSTPTCLATAAFIALVSSATAHVDGSLTTRHGAVVKGTVQGALYVLDETATVSIERGAVVNGDLMLPADKTKDAKNTPAAGGNGGGNDNAKVSAKTQIAVADTDSVKGKQKATDGFNPPKTEKPAKPNGNKDIVLATAGSETIDFTKAKDITVKHVDRQVVLPPGTYGDVAIDHGHLIIGTKGSMSPDRYYFQSLSVGADGRLELLGRAVVIVGTLGSIEGKLGNTLYTQWLDLRVASGPVTLQSNSEVHGVVMATDSPLTISPHAKARGGIVCDQATIEATAVFTGIAPSWSKESSGNSLPLFVHKAARLESGLPHLVDRTSGSYTVATSYVDDLPVIELSLSPGAKPGAGEEQRAFFDACCAALEVTAFSSATIVVERRPASLRLEMGQSQFLDHLWAIGRKAEPRESIRRIKDDPVLLQRFMERSLKIAQTFGTPRDR